MEGREENKLKASMGSVDIKQVKGMGTITPFNGFIRVTVKETRETTQCGVVTDASKGSQCKVGDVVYYPRSKALLMKFNGNEDTFVNESDIVFKVEE